MPKKKNKKKVKTAPTQPRSVFAAPEVSVRMITQKGPTKKKTLEKQSTKYKHKLFEI